MDPALLSVRSVAGGPLEGWLKANSLAPAAAKVPVKCTASATGELASFWIVAPRMPTDAVESFLIAGLPVTSTDSEGAGLAGMDTKWLAVSMSSAAGTLLSVTVSLMVSDSTVPDVLGVALVVTVLPPPIETSLCCRALARSLRLVSDASDALAGLYSDWSTKSPKPSPLDPPTISPVSGSG